MILSPLNSAKDHRSVLENAVTHYYICSFRKPQAKALESVSFGVNTTITCNSYFACYLALLTLILAIKSIDTGGYYRSPGICDAPYRLFNITSKVLRSGRRCCAPTSNEPSVPTREKAHTLEDSSW